MGALGTASKRPPQAQEIAFLFAFLAPGFGIVALAWPFHFLNILGSTCTNAHEYVEEIVTNRLQSLESRALGEPAQLHIIPKPVSGQQDAMPVPRPFYNHPEP